MRCVEAGNLREGEGMSKRYQVHMDMFQYEITRENDRSAWAAEPDFVGAFTECKGFAASRLASMKWEIAHSGRSLRKLRKADVDRQADAQ